MESIDHFIQQQKEMLQMEKNNLGFLESAQTHRTLEHANHARMVDDSTSIDCDEDDDLEKQRILQLEKDAKDAHNCSLSNDSDKGKKHFEEQYEMDPHSDKFYSSFPSFSDQAKHKQDLAHSRHQEYQEYLSQVANKESLEHKRKAASNLQYHHEQELQQNQRQRDVHQSNIRQHDHEVNVQRQKDHDILDIERDIRSIDAQDAAVTTSPRYHQELHENLRHTDFSGSKSNPDAVHDRNQEQVQIANRKKMEYQRDLMKQIEDKKQELEALRERDRIEDEKLTKYAHDQYDQHQQSQPLPQQAHGARRFTEVKPAVVKINFKSGGRHWIFKRLQEQLQAIQLEDELQKERARTEQMRINNEHNHIRRMHLLSKLENDHKLYNPYANRKAQSENGREQQRTMVTDSPNPKVYKYFSTSAQYPAAVDTYKSKPHYVAANRTVFMDSAEEEIGPPPVPPLPPATYCMRCHNELNEPVCAFCERKRNNLPINESNCLKCSTALTSPIDRAAGLCTFCRQTNLRCGYCHKLIDVCPNCNAVFCMRCHRRRQQQEHQKHENEENIRPSRAAIMAVDERPILAVQSKPSVRPTSPYLKPKQSTMYRSFDIYDSDSENDLPAGQSVVIRHDNKVPYSMNVERSSIFYPRRMVDEPKLAVGVKNGQIFVEDLDEKLAKYARNYGELRNRNSFGNKRTSYGENDDSFPLPLMPAAVSVSKEHQQPLQQTHDSPALKMLHRKWEIPAVQKHLLSENQQKPTKQRVLTQLGAIRKQLQLEKMELDQTMLTHRK